MWKHLDMHMTVGKSAYIFLQHESKKFSGLSYLPVHVLELRIIFYVESNRLCLGAMSTLLLKQQ